MLILFLAAELNEGEKFYKSSLLMTQTISFLDFYDIKTFTIYLM